MAEIVSQAGDFDNVGVTPEGFSEFARDLRNLKGVGQSGSREVVLAGDHHLSLRCESPKPRRVKHPRPIPSEGTPNSLLDRFLGQSCCVIGQVAGDNGSRTHGSTLTSSVHAAW